MRILVRAVKGAIAVSILAQAESSRFLAMAQAASQAPKVPDVTPPVEVTPDVPSILEFSNQQFWLALGLIALMAVLFWFLFYFSRKLEKSSYLGDVFQDSIEYHEYYRMRGEVDQNRSEGVYRREAERKLANREIYEPASPPYEPDNLAHLFTRYASWRDRRRESNQRRAEFEMSKYGAFATYAEPMRSESVSFWDEAPNSGIKFSELDDSDKAKYEEFKKISDDYIKACEAYDRTLNAEEYELYQAALANVRGIAKKHAKNAANIDYGALRGKGAAFVLEFTAIVVIIFSAVILGVLHILVADQIATLLAAIAGYVLGRAGSRERENISQGDETTNNSNKAESK